MLQTLQNQALLDDIYQTAFEYVPTLFNGFMEVAEQLRLGNQSDAFGKMHLLFDGIEWNLSVIQKISILNQENEQGVLRIISDRLVSNLQIVNASIAKEDYVTVADVFQYEISEALEEWWQITKCSVLANARGTDCDESE